MDNITSPLNDKVLNRILDDLQRLNTENARMRIALETIILYASRSRLNFGLWRKVVDGLARGGLVKESPDV